MPSFSSIVQATPIDSGFNPGLGYYVGSGIANQLLSVSQSAISNKQQKQSIAGFADAMESTDPEAAKMYRSLADSIPAFDPTSLNPSTPGSKAAGTSGGGKMSFSGATGEVMSNMLDMVKLRTQQAGQMALENQRSKNDNMLQGLRSTAAMAEIIARKNADIAKEKERGDYNVKVAEIKNQFKGQDQAVKLAVAAMELKGREAAIEASIKNTDTRTDASTKNTDTRAKATTDAAQIRADAQRAAADAKAAGGGKPPSNGDIKAFLYNSPNVAAQYAQAEADSKDTKDVSGRTKNSGIQNKIRLEAWASSQLQARKSGAGQPVVGVGELLGEKQPEAQPPP